MTVSEEVFWRQVWRAEHKKRPVLGTRAVEYGVVGGWSEGAGLRGCLRGLRGSSGGHPGPKNQQKPSSGIITDTPRHVVPANLTGPVFIAPGSRRSILRQFFAHGVSRNIFAIPECALAIVRH